MSRDRDMPQRSDHEVTAEEIAAECEELKRSLQEVFDGLREGRVTTAVARTATRVTEARIAELISKLQKLLPGAN